jgi:hypothetical protein
MITRAAWELEWTAPWRYLLRMSAAHPELSQFCTAFVLAVEGNQDSFQYCTKAAAHVWTESQKPGVDLAGEERGATNAIIFLFNALWELHYDESAFEITYANKTDQPAEQAAQHTAVQTAVSL